MGRRFQVHTRSHKGYPLKRGRSQAITVGRLCQKLMCSAGSHHHGPCSRLTLRITAYWAKYLPLITAKTNPISGPIWNIRPPRFPGGPASALLPRRVSCFEANLPRVTGQDLSTSWRAWATKGEAPWVCQHQQRRDSAFTIHRLEY